MPVIGEFIKYCTQILKANFGQSSSGIIYKVKSKKNLNDTSDLSDFNKFIDLIELDINELAEKNKVINICDAFRAKAIELMGEQKSSEVSVINEINRDINTFLMRNTLLTEGEINGYAKHLTLKYGSFAEKVEKDFTKKIKILVRSAINRKKIKEEVNRFLTTYPQQTQTDVDEFIYYIHLLRLKFQEDELRQQIKKERIFRKFHEPKNVQEIPEIDQFVETIKTPDDKKNIIKAIQKQEVGYIINHESGISDGLLFEEFGDDKLNDPIEVCDRKLKMLTEGRCIGGTGSDPGEFFDELPAKLIEDSKIFESKIKEALDDFFETEGIPTELEINDIAKDLISCGCKQDENQLIETLKRLSKENVILSLNDSIINNEIKFFVRRHPSFEQLEVDNFINYLKGNKLNINDEDVKDLIERERLFVKFKDMDRNEGEEEKISRQYIELYNSSKKEDYNYIVTYDEK
ncbi:MAG TPA: hypothetical protein VIO58_04175, partial [Candidatus Methanoperedens sp.]